MLIKRNARENVENYVCEDIYRDRFVRFCEGRSREWIEGDLRDFKKSIWVYGLGIIRFW